MRRLPLTPDDRYASLEVSTSGLWLFTEVPTGLPITDAVVDWFVTHDEAVAGDGDAAEEETGNGNAGEERAVTERARRRERPGAERHRRRAAERRERRGE